MAAKVAIVTGANRGLGLETTRQLVSHGLEVVACMRTPERPPPALPGPIASGTVHPVRLDVADPGSVRDFARTLPEGLSVDVLVNNAGVALDGFDDEVVRRTLAVNFHGALAMADAVLPHLRAGGRVVSVSSGLGDLSCVGPDLRTRFSAPTLDRAGLLALVDGFARAVAAGTHRREGWPSSAYAVSKVALNAMTRVLARELADDPRGILVCSVCPGWVRTDMGGRSAPSSVQEGADTIVWAAVEPGLRETGVLYRARARAAF